MRTYQARITRSLASVSFCLRCRSSDCARGLADRPGIPDAALPSLPCPVSKSGMSIRSGICGCDSSATCVVKFPVCPDPSPLAMATGEVGGGTKSWIRGGLAPTSSSGCTDIDGCDPVSIDIALRAIGRFWRDIISNASRSGGFVFVLPVTGLAVVEGPAPPPDEPYPSEGRSDDRCPLLFLLPAIWFPPDPSPSDNHRFPSVDSGSDNGFARCRACIADGTFGVGRHVRDDSPNCGVVGAVEGGSRLEKEDEDEDIVCVLESRNGNVGSRYNRGEVEVDPTGRDVGLVIG